MTTPTCASTSRRSSPLFRPDRARRAVVCLDSTPGVEVVARSEVPTVTVGTPALAADPDVAAGADWVVEILDERPTGTEFRLTARDGRSLTTVVPVIGRHMAANAGLAIVMILEAGYAWERIVAALDGGRIDAYLPGRTELVSGDRGPAVYVDFGHSPDAFEKTLAAVRRVTPGKVVMLFGADGDRDATQVQLGVAQDLAQQQPAAVAGADDQHRARVAPRAVAAQRALVDEMRDVRTAPMNSAEQPEQHEHAGRHRHRDEARRRRDQLRAARPRRSRRARTPTTATACSDLQVLALRRVAHPVPVEPEQREDDDGAADRERDRASEQVRRSAAGRRRRSAGGRRGNRPARPAPRPARPAAGRGGGRERPRSGSGGASARF